MRKIVFLNLLKLLKEIISEIEQNPKHYLEFYIPRKMRNKEYDKADLFLIQRILNKSINTDESYLIIGSYGGRFDMSKNGGIIALSPDFSYFPKFREANLFNKIATIDPKIVWYNYELYIANEERKKLTEKRGN
jgi:hypothetical protein